MNMQVSNSSKEADHVSTMKCLQRAKECGLAWVGVFFAVLCAFTFGCEDMLLYAVAKITNPALVFVYSSVSAFIVCVVLAALVRPSFGFIFVPFHLALVILQGAFNSITQICVCISIFTIGPGNAIAIFFTMPIFSNVFNVMFFGGSFKLKNLFFAILSFIGVIFVSKSSIINEKEEGIKVFENDVLSKLIGFAMGIIGAISFSGSLAVGQKLAELGTHSLITILSYSWQYSIYSVSLCTCFNGWNFPENPVTSVALTATGLFTLFGMAMQYLAVSFESPVTVSVILTLHVVFTYTGQYIFFVFPFHWTIAVGVPMIISSCIGMTLTQDRNGSSYKDEGKDCEEETQSMLK